MSAIKKIAILGAGALGGAYAGKFFDIEEYTDKEDGEWTYWTVLVLNYRPK